MQKQFKIVLEKHNQDLRKNHFERRIFELLGKVIIQ